MKKKILVLATSFLDKLLSHPKDEGKAKKMLCDLETINKDQIEIIYQCDRNPERPLQPQEFIDVVAVVADLEKYDRELLSKISKKVGGSLKLISRYGIGYNSIDLQAATEFGVIVTNAPGCNALPTAEWALSTIVAVAGKRVLHHNTASAGKAKESLSRLDIFGKKLGVIGTGTIGKYLVKLMKGYEMEVMAYDIYKDEYWAKNNDVTYVDVEEICRQCDVISLHASANEQIIAQKEIELMKETTVLVNCARGILTDNRAIYKAVKKGKIWGYGLDEMWLEKDLTLDGLNFIVSSHVGSDTDSGKIGMQVMSTSAVVDFINGKIPEFVVNKDVLKDVNILT